MKVILMEDRVTLKQKLDTCLIHTDNLRITQLSHNVFILKSRVGIWSWMQAAWIDTEYEAIRISKFNWQAYEGYVRQLAKKIEEHIGIGCSIDIQVYYPQ